MHYDRSYRCYVKYIGLKKTSKAIENIAKSYGHEVSRSPPYHFDLNAIELRRLRSDLLNPKFGIQKSALLWLKSHNFSDT